MDFKLVSKNNLGAATSLLLVVLLSQSKFFNFLLDTALGRAILIMFNSSDIGYMEGFTAPSSKNNNNSSTTNTSTMTNDSTTTSTTTPTTPTLTDEQKQQLISKLQEKSKNSSKDSSTTTTSSSVASEGFDIIGAENTIKRGKQSNSIPVNSFMKNSDDIMPFGGSFSDSYSAF